VAGIPWYRNFWTKTVVGALVVESELDEDFEHPDATSTTTATNAVTLTALRVDRRMLALPFDVEPDCLALPRARCIRGIGPTSQMTDVSSTTEGVVPRERRGISRPS
jgi:hypothetical protein